MPQQQLWHDTIYDALKADIDAAGGNKTVGHELWPTLSISTAEGRLRNALNPDQQQKLDPDEMLAIKRLAAAVGSYSTFNFEATHFGFKIEWLDPQDEIGSLLREMSDDTKRIEARQKRIERLLELQGRR